ncbi:MAG TPA: hypothetical protein VMW41_00820 [Candidatus Bathyarchaeia archaeon]|nr:hypothetical protein [Candidatus Bathyarchaeia archaeon]
MKQYKGLILKLIVTGWCLLTFFPFSAALAQDWSTPPDQPADLKDIEVVFARIIGVAIPLAGFAGLIMLIIGGFQYLTAGEDPKAVEQASKSLTSVFTGLVLLISAWIILKAIQTITGINVTIFKISP